MASYSSGSSGTSKTRMIVLSGLLVVAGGVAAWRLLRSPAEQNVDSSVLTKAAQIQDNIQKASTGPVPDAAPAKKPAEIQKSANKHGPVAAPK